MAITGSRLSVKYKWSIDPKKADPIITILNGGVDEIIEKEYPSYPIELRHIIESTQKNTEYINLSPMMEEIRLSIISY